MFDTGQRDADGDFGLKPSKEPNGQAVITPKNGPAFVEALAVKKFHGVGPATAPKMELLGIVTGADLQAQELSFLQEHVGKSASGITKWLARSMNGRCRWIGCANWSPPKTPSR